MITLSQFLKGLTLPDALVPNANFALVVLNDVLGVYPGTFSFNSGFRDAAKNAAVGGVSTSYHTKALAFDITPLDGNYNIWLPRVRAIVGKYGYEVIDERGKNHLHCEPAPGWSISQVPQTPANSNNSTIQTIGVIFLAWLIFG